MKQIFSLFIFQFLFTGAFAQTVKVQSPDGKTNFLLTVKEKVSFTVTHNEQTVIGNSVINLITDVPALNIPFKIKKSQSRSVNTVLYPVVRRKFKTVNDNYNELSVSFTNQFTLHIRAYNNGVAYRWGIQYNKPFKVINEQAGFAFASTDTAWYPLEKSFYSHNERQYKRYAISQISKDSLASLPLLVQSNKTKVLITEADLYDYPGMWMNGNNSNELQATFPAYPKEERDSGILDRLIISREDFIASVNGPRTFPWRIMMLAETDSELLTNLLPYQLNRAATEDFSWVKAGKAQWDWWNNNTLRNVNFKAGVNTETYKYYIDFAASQKLEYVILDEGWSVKSNLLATVPEIDMEAIMQEANSKGVGIVLWASWLLCEKQMIPFLDQCAKWGVKGIKVDFMQRDDQKMMNFYERTAKECAKRKLLVSFHGACKPTGMEHQYPNVITYEGVFGLENSKWDKEKNIGPEHNVTIPFIRMAAGPMDYTPGAMMNAQLDSWEPVYENPWSQGTRCHQLAMYVVYESPLQMLADNPSNYMNEKECLEFLSPVPSEWEETKIIAAKVGDYIITAKKALNGDWYIGGMTDWTERDFVVPLTFIDKGIYIMLSWQDGMNADKDARDYKKTTATVSEKDSINIKMAKGGGFAIRLVKQ